jgi:YD repeat-containing protein
MKKTMKKLVLFMISMLCFIAYGQNPLNKDVINGNPQSVIQYELKLKNGVIQVEDTVKSSFLKIFYDDFGKIIKQEQTLGGFSETGDSWIVGSYECKYNLQGKLINITNFGRPFQKYEYDDRDNLLKIQMYDSEEIFGHWIYKYDEQGNQTERAGYLDESFVERWIMKYDADGKIVEEYMVEEEPDSIPAYIIKSYDYDFYGNLTNLKFSEVGKEKISINKYTYNENGDIIEDDEKNDFQGTETTTSYKYIYDKNKNWIQKKESINGQLCRYIERKIEYR